MKQTFSPKIPSKAGAVTFMTLTVGQLKALFGNPKFAFKGQRDHESNASKRKHCAGELSDASLEFFGAYCEELGHYVNTDGYHRAHNIMTERAIVRPGDTITLLVRRVKTVQELTDLYDKYNSSKASKKAKDYMASGARGQGKLNIMADPWIAGSASAVQKAAGTAGSLETRAATEKLADGLQLIAGLRLQKAAHVRTGGRAALIAIAQHATDKALARSFISAVATPSEWVPVTLGMREKLILKYRDCLINRETPDGVPFQTTGDTAASRAMRAGLAAYYNYERVSRKLRATDHVSMTLADFVVDMKILGARKTA